jgi:hypothetical protein
MKAKKGAATILWVSCLVCIPSVSAGREKLSLQIDSFLGCRAEIGYVVFYRVANRSKQKIEVPADLLPWAPGAFAMNYEFISEGGSPIEPAGVVTDSPGRVTILPNHEMIGDVRLSLLFSSKEIDAALTARDALIRWKYSAAIQKNQLTTAGGEMKLLGRSFYEKCKNGF